MVVIIIDVVVLVASKVKGDLEGGVNEGKFKGEEVMKVTREVVIEGPLEHQGHGVLVNIVEDAHEGAESISKAMVGSKNEKGVFTEVEDIGMSLNTVETHAMVIICP